MTSAVADTGPFIHLDEIRFPQGLDVFRRIHVSPLVVQELQAFPRGPGARLLRRANIHRATVSRDEAAAAKGFALFRKLSATDRTTLAIAHARDFTLVTDDIDLREACKGLGVEAVGTIGLVVRAVARGLASRDEASRALDALLVDSTLFVTPSLVDAAKQAMAKRGL